MNIVLVVSVPEEYKKEKKKREYLVMEENEEVLLLFWLVLKNYEMLRVYGLLRRGELWVLEVSKMNRRRMIIIIYKVFCIER